VPVVVVPVAVPAVAAGGVPTLVSAAPDAVVPAVPAVVLVAGVVVVVVACPAAVMPAVIELPEPLTAGVTTVVTAVPVGADVAGGAPAGVNDACGSCGVGGGFGVGGVGVTGATARTVGSPSGSTQFTSRLEQKSGMDVRSVEMSAAQASPAAAVASAPPLNANLRTAFLNARVAMIDHSTVPAGPSRRSRTI
jgi:hypothetical protein